MSVTWVIIAVMSVMIPGEAANWSGSYKWTYNDQFASEQGCKQHKFSEAFLDDEPELMAAARRKINNPHAQIRFEFTCAAVGDPV